MDVVTLDDALQGKLNKKRSTSAQLTLKDSLQAYENNRGPEHRALIRLARVGAPFQVRETLGFFTLDSLMQLRGVLTNVEFFCVVQYNQPWKRHRLGKFLWTANVGIRLILHKLTAKLLAPPAIILMVRNPNMTFRRIMQRADTTTLGLVAMVAVIIYNLVLKKLVFPLLSH